MIHNLNENYTIQSTKQSNLLEQIKTAKESTFPGTINELPNGDIQITYTNNTLKTAPIVHWSTNINWNQFQTQTMTKTSSGSWKLTISGQDGSYPLYYKISNNSSNWVFLDGQPTIKTNHWISNVFYHSPKQEPELPGTVEELHDGVIKFTYHNPSLQIAPVFHWSTDSNWHQFKTETMTKSTNGDWIFTISGIKGTQNVYYKISNDQHDWILLKNQPTMTTGPWISNVFRHSPQQDPEFPGTITQTSNNTIQVTYTNPNLKVPPVFHWSTDDTWTHFQTKTMNKGANGTWTFTIPKIKSDEPIYYKISNTPQDWIFLKGQPTIKTVSWISNVFYPCINKSSSSTSSTKSNSATNSISSTKSNSATNSISSTKSNSATNSISGMNSNSVPNSISGMNSNSVPNSISSMNSNNIIGNNSTITSLPHTGISNDDKSKNSIIIFLSGLGVFTTLLSVFAKKRL
ncbi:MAG: hypothetical protein ACRC57_08995 [Sarcina sp.]